MTSTIELQEFLHKYKARDVKPVVVFLGGEVFPTACHFTQDITNASIEGIYVVGIVPGVYGKASGKLVLTLEGDEREWYFAGNWGELSDLAEPRSAFHAQYHPFGPWFLLRPWQCDVAIDFYARIKYQRVPLKVVEHEYSLQGSSTTS